MQIKLNKPLSELNHLLMRNNLQPTPKRSTLINQYPNPKNHKENQLNVNNMSRSPARSTSRKTIASRDESLHSLNHQDSRNRAKSRRQEPELLRRCQNHEDNEGNFHINIEGEDLYYCERCALKLKNQGFPIRKAYENSVSEENHRRDHEPKTSLLATYSHFDGHPQFQTLRVLLAEIYQSQQKMVSTQNNRSLQQFFSRLCSDLDNFYDGIEQMVQNRRESSKASLQALSQSVLLNKKSSEFGEAFEEIKMMKKDIEENVESIIGEVEEDTFIQCVENYKDRLEVLNKIAGQRVLETEKIKQKYERYLEDEARNLMDEIEKIELHTISCSSQKVLNSESEEQMNFEEGVRGPFRNLFNDKDKSRKRLISRK